MSRAHHALSAFSVLRAMNRLRTDRRTRSGGWIPELDTLALLIDWQDGRRVAPLQRWPLRRSLHPHRHPREQAVSAGFLARWRDASRGHRWVRLLLGLVFALSTAGTPASALGAAERAQVFSKAHTAYQQGRWDVAAAGYRSLIADGVDDPVVWYDLGNAYSQLDDVGRARACYEHALRQRPRDADTRANLAILLTRLDARESVTDPLASLTAMLSRNEIAVGGAVFWVAFVAAFIVWLRQRRSRVGWLASALLIGVLLFAGLGAIDAARPEQAVVIPGEVQLYNGPGKEYTPSVSLRAGARVDLLGSEGAWRRVGGTQGVTGWLRVEQVERI